MRTANDTAADVFYVGDPSRFSCGVQLFDVREAERMARLLVIHHTPSPATHELLEAVRSGTAADGLEDVEAVFRPALSVTAPDVLESDGYLLGTPANLGYMSGALKHAFDTFYYPCLGATNGRPWGLWVHGNNDVNGAISAVRRIVTGLEWREVYDPVEVIGTPRQDDRDACWELAATVAAQTLGLG